MTMPAGAHRHGIDEDKDEPFVWFALDCSDKQLTEASDPGELLARSEQHLRRSLETSHAWSLTKGYEPDGEPVFSLVLHQPMRRVTPIPASTW